MSSPTVVECLASDDDMHGHGLCQDRNEHLNTFSKKFLEQHYNSLHRRLEAETETETEEPQGHVGWPRYKLSARPW